MQKFNLMNEAGFHKVLLLCESLFFIEEVFLHLKGHNLVDFSEVLSRLRYFAKDILHFHLLFCLLLPFRFSTANYSGKTRMNPFIP